MTQPLTLESIENAARRIAGQVIHTPLAPSPGLAGDGRQVWLKLECQQVSGSFKLRGATNAVANLDAKRRAAGVVCVSTGNHGRGLAYAARRGGIRAVVCMGGLAPRNKIEGIQALGAEVRIVGNDQDDAQVEADRLADEEGMTMIPPFDHPDVIAGQGVIALEIMRDLERVDTVVVPVSGGGLCGGIALGVKALSPRTRVIGVSMQRGCAMHDSLRAGKPVTITERATLADALGGNIGLDNAWTFGLMRDYVDHVVLVSEREIAEGIRHLYFREQQVAEGAGAVGVAALLAGKIPQPGVTVVVVSGRNIDMQLHRRLINGEDPDTD